MLRLTGFTTYKLIRQSQLGVIDRALSDRDLIFNTRKISSSQFHQHIGIIKQKKKKYCRNIFEKYKEDSFPELSDIYLFK